MFSYAVVMIPACLFLLAVRMTPEYVQRRVAYMVVVVITAFAALRGYVGTDTYAYHRMFENFSTESMAETVQFTEPLFVALIKLAASVSENSFVFVGLIALVQGLILLRLIKVSKKPADMLAVYIAVFFVNFEFNILRAGTSILLLMAARQVWKEKNGTLFYFFTFAAVFAHYSAVVAALPMIFMRENRMSLKILVLILVVPLIAAVSFLLVSPGQIEKYVGYIEQARAGSEASYGVGFFILILLYFLLYLSAVTKKNFLPLTALFLSWITIRWLSNHILFLDRIEIIVNALMLYGIVEKRIAGWQRQTQAAALICLTFLSLYGTLDGLEKSDAGARGMETLDDKIAANTSPYIPYKFFWNE